MQIFVDADACPVVGIVESSYYEGRVGITSYSPGDTPIKGIFTFGE